METRKCKKCGTEKSIENYKKSKIKNKTYTSHICLECVKKENNERAKQYYIKNKEKIKKYQENYRNKNKEKMKEYFKKHYQENKKEKLLKAKEYRQKNKDKINQYRLNKTNNDKIYAFKCTIRKMLSRSFTRKKYVKNKHLEEIVGLDINKLSCYLLETFKNNYGYEWDCKEPVHIDHIIPLAIAKTEEEIIELCHYTNLQLLKAEDNLKKGSKLEF